MSFIVSKFKAIMHMFFVKSLTDDDIDYIQQHLSKQEQILFYRMSVIDQKHSLNVAHTVKKLIGRRSRINSEKMIKTALLHDIGKADIKLTVGNRVYQTLLFFFIKPLANYLAEKGKNSLSSKRAKILYFYKYHGALGADLLREIGTDENIAYLVENHHTDSSINEPIELSVLREADNLN